MSNSIRRALQRVELGLEDAEDFAELTGAERQLVNLRRAVSRAVWARREQQHLTPGQVARKLNSTQSRVAKMEAGAADVSLDLLFRGLFALGGGLNDLRLAHQADPDGALESLSLRAQALEESAGR